jgi:PAS domain S-box-containing protein
MTIPNLPDAAARLAAIVLSADDAIVSKDLMGTITSWNPAADRLFGYTADEAIGKNILMIVPEERYFEEEYVLSQVRIGLPISHYETIRRRKDGTFVEISLSVSPIRTPEGRVVGASKIARDITEQKRLRQLAEDASRSKDEFLAVLSHELRTPLNTVLGYARMLRVDDEMLAGEKRARALEILERNAEALARLVNDVLDTSRAVTGKLRLNIEEVQLNDVLHDAVETIQPTAEAKQVSLRVEAAPDLRLFGDPDRLQQVGWNLLANAVKFTPPGGVVTIRATRDGRDIVIEVADTGVGIAPEHIPHIFQRFWQAESGTTRESSGLGIGLSFTRYVVELHGGRIVASSPGTGRGATFTVRLPVSAVPSRSSLKPSSESA